MTDKMLPNLNHRKVPAIGGSFCQSPIRTYLTSVSFMDILSVQGATSTIHACETLNRMLERGLNIRPLGMFPVKLNRRLAVTEMVLDTLASISERREVPIYGPIRTDQSVVKAAADRQFLADYDPKSKALEDYEQLADGLLSRFGKTEAVPINVKTA